MRIYLFIMVIVLAQTGHAQQMMRSIRGVPLIINGGFAVDTIIPPESEATLSQDLIDDFIFLWRGDTTASGNLQSEIDTTEYITVTSKDFVTTIPYTSSSTLAMPDSTFLEADAFDALWHEQDSSLRSITPTQLISVDFSKTLVKYQYDSGYNISWIGILHPDSTITSAKWDTLHDMFDLHPFWSGTWNDNGQTKDNRSLESTGYKGWLARIEAIGYTAPSSTVQEGLNRLCVNLQLEDVWDFDRFFVFMLNDSALVDSAGTVSFSMIDTNYVEFPVVPTYTARGFSGNGSSQYADTNYDPADGTNYTLDSGSRLAYCYDGINSGAVDGCVSSAVLSMADGYINRIQGGNVGGFTSSAFIAINRSDSANVEMYYDSSSEQNSDASTSLPGQNIVLLRNQFEYGANEMSIYAIGRSFSSAEMTIIRTSIVNYKNYIGL